MRVLITGGNGFLGKYLVKVLNECNYTMLDAIEHLLTPSSSECNLTDISSTMAFFDRERPDVVVHLAAVCGGIGFNKIYPATATHENLSMAVNLMSAIEKYNVGYLYTAGSVCSYPKHCSIPFKEDNLWNGFPEETNGGYGFSKRALYVLQDTYRQQYGLKGAHLVLANMYGPHDNFDLETGHVISAFIRKFNNAVYYGHDTVECWGTGKATREFLYVEDCAEAFAKAIAFKFDYAKPINIGTGSDVSIFDLAKSIANITGFTGEIKFTGEVSDGQPKRKLDVSRAKEVLGWEADTNLYTGLNKTNFWYQNNIDTLPVRESFIER